MADIIVKFNRTTNDSYISYAKLNYSIAYTDNESDLQSTAKITVKFYIKPDSYAYSTSATETLYLGIRKGNSSATLSKVNISPTLTDGVINSDTYNYVGTATFNVTYTSTSTYNIYLAVGYTNNATSRFSPFYMPKSDGSTYESYEYTSGTSNAVTLEKRINYTACGAPTSFTASPNPFESVVNLSWSGAKAGTSNAISGYQIQYSRGSDNVTWSTWANIGGGDIASTNTSGTKADGANLTDGYYLKYRIRTKGSAGSSYYSAWKEIGSIRKNSDPVAPTVFTSSNNLIVSGASITLSWSGASDIDGNIKEYQIQKSINNGSTWQSVKTVTSSSTSGSTSILLAESAGTTVLFRICVVDDLDIASEYKTGVSIVINCAPTTATEITLSKTKYNQGDTIILSWSGASDVDGNIQKYKIQQIITINNVWQTWMDLAEVTTVDTNGSKDIIPTIAANHQKIKFRVCTIDTLGAVSGYIESEEILRDDYTGLHIGVNSLIKKGYAYVCIAGIYTEADVYVCKNGIYKKGVD